MKLTDQYYREWCSSDPFENIQFREECLYDAQRSEDCARQLWMMCARDPLFFLATFGVLLETRDTADWQGERFYGNVRKIPFIPRPYQIEAIRDCLGAWGRKDILFIKSREMGATWLILYLIDHSWRFEEQSHYGLMSKDEKSVDSTDDPDSLMAKLDFIDAHLPWFLKVNRDRKGSAHTIKNLDNGSTIAGQPCIADVARGGRKRVYVMDEMHSFPAETDYAAHDSLQHVTYSRVMISTPKRDKGQTGAFYDAVMDTQADMARIDMDWKDDIDKSAGLYSSVGNSVIFLDPDYAYPEKYSFILDGKIRSPYYDFECRRPLATPQSIASELDKDFGGATHKFFEDAVIARARGTCKTPTHKGSIVRSSGEMLYEPELIVSENNVGPVELWLFPESGITVGNNGRLVIPPWKRYSSGWDIAQGMKGQFGSYSSGCFFDTQNGHQVCEWKGNDIPVHELPYFSFALAELFNRAVICPEATGFAGSTFVKIIADPHKFDGRPNLWLRPTSEKGVGSKTSKAIGYDNKDGGHAIFSFLSSAIKLGSVTIRSSQVVQECQRYFVDPADDKLKHPHVGKGRQNSAATAVSHGDCAIACAIAWYSIHNVPPDSAPVEPEEVPEESVTGRYLARQSRPDRFSWKKSVWPGWEEEPEMDPREYLEKV